ncbi:MAG: c-type cytochrome [Planctomycetota bacterium]
MFRATSNLIAVLRAAILSFVAISVDWAGTERVSAAEVQTKHQPFAAIFESPLPQLDVIEMACESPDPDDRILALRGLLKWWHHHPGATGTLQRLIHDANNRVRAQAILAGIDRVTTLATSSQQQHIESDVATVALLRMIARALKRYDDQWTPEQRDQFVDALDQRPLRSHWKQTDRFGIRQWMKDALRTRQTPHTFDDLRTIEIPAPTPNVIASGRDAFSKASCVACHRVGGYGQATAPELTGIGQCYDSEQLIRHIMYPSADIHDAGRVEQIVTRDGRVIVGQVTASRGDDSIRLRTNLMKPEQWVSVDVDEIEARQPHPISPMPVGLLNKLTPTQVADVIVYLQSDGGALADPPSGDHADH